MTDVEADALVEEYLAGRQWLRCTCCGAIGDAKGDSSDEWRVSVDAGAIVAVLCLACGDERPA